MMDKIDKPYKAAPKQKIFVVTYVTDMPGTYWDMGFVSKSRAEEYKRQKEQDEKNVLPSFKRTYSIDTLVVDCQYSLNEGPVFVYD